MDSQSSNSHLEFKITPLDDEEALDLTVSSSRLAEKNGKLKKSTEPQHSRQTVPINNPEPQMKTTPVKNQPPENKKQTPVFHDLMDTDSVPSKIEEKPFVFIQNTKEEILDKVFNHSDPRGF